MTQLSLTQEADIDLRNFFANIEKCRGKNPLTHGLHPYPAKFIPHIPRALIRAFSSPGDIVADLMCGSGTAVLEAISAGRTGIGCDINPIAVLVAAAKTTPLEAESRAQLLALSRDLKAVRDALAVDPEHLAGLEFDSPPLFQNREKWFGPGVTTELAYLLTQIRELTGQAARVLAQALFSSILVGVSNQESETRWCAKPKAIRPGEALQRFLRKLDSSLERVRELEAVRTAPSFILRANARRAPLGDDCVHMIVTSPPYANSHDYYLYNKLRMFWLGEDVASVQSAEIGSRNRHSDQREEVGVYVSEMTDVIKEMHRVLVPGGVAAIVVADAVIRGEFFDMGQLYGLVGTSVGFREKARFEFAHVKFNSAFQRGFGTRHPKRTHVLVFEKPLD